MNRRQFLAAAGLGVCAMGTAAAQPAAPRPNILWINFDDGRADALGCYGAPWAKTPVIDAIAARGVRFHNAIVQNPVCVPARRSMKTGCYVHRAGPMAMGKEPEAPAPFLDREDIAAVNARPNLLDAFAAMGMKPVNVGKIHGFPESFDDRGGVPILFDVAGKPSAYFTQAFGESSALLDAERVYTDTHRWQIGGVLDIDPAQTDTARLANKAIEALNGLTANPDPFFFRVSFHAPHVPCHVPRADFIDPAEIHLPLPTAGELASKPRFEQGPLRTYCGAALSPEQIGLARGTYYGMLAHADAQIGRILDALRISGRLDNTVIAVTSDQGFQLGEHGLWKKRLFYEANVRAPLILAGPGLPDGKVIDAPVEFVDFLPTLLDLAGGRTPRDIDGESLLPLIAGERTAWREATFSEIDHSQSLYAELRGGGRRVMVRTSEWKLEEFMDPRTPEPDGSLYHLLDDPAERVNRFDDPACAPILSKLRELARDWDASTALRA